MDFNQVYAENIGTLAAIIAEESLRSWMWLKVAGILTMINLVMAGLWWGYTRGKAKDYHTRELCDSFVVLTIVILSALSFFMFLHWFMVGQQYLHPHHYAQLLVQGEYLDSLKGVR